MRLSRSEDIVKKTAPERARELESFAREVERGLSDSPKHLPCRFFYDCEGSRLFEEICCLDEYYLTRTEMEILERHADEIIGGLPVNVVLVELGSGSSVKTRLIIEAILERHGRASYTPIDISRSMLEQSAADLREDYDGLDIVSIAAEYREGLRRLEDFERRPKLILWIGSSIGNFERNAAASFLSDIAEGLSQRDRMLIGFDMVKDVDVMTNAYNDSRGVTAAFNLNLLTRINRELGGCFDTGSFAHIAEFSGAKRRIEMYLVSMKEQLVRVGRLGRAFHLGEGERIHTENSHKYTQEAIEEMAGEVGFRIIRQWYDRRRWFNLTLFGPAE